MTEIHSHTEERLSIEAVVRLTQVSADSIRRWCECGLIEPEEGREAEPAFFTRHLFMIRRLERMRENYGVNDAGLRRLVELLDEVERLREELRFLR
jgi:MerR family transcriptional regulator/heat shock protein HspR